MTHDIHQWEKLPHKTMTLTEYSAMPIQGWHEVCRDVDGFGNVGIRYVTNLTNDPRKQIINPAGPEPPIELDRWLAAQKKIDALTAVAINLVAICQAEGFFVSRKMVAARKDVETALSNTDDHKM